MNLKNILLYKRRQSKISFTWNSNKGKTDLSDRKWIRGFLGEEEGGPAAKGHDGIFWADGNFLS